MMSLQSSNQDPSLGEKYAEMEDRPFSARLSTHSGITQTKKNLAMTSRNREKYTITANGRLIRTPSTGSTWPGHLEKGPVFADEVSRHHCS